MKNYFLYARKSTESDDRQTLSIEAQTKELQDVAERKQIKIAKIFTESMSAKEPGRPVFNEMIKKLRRGAADGILCWKLDRLARNPVDGATVAWEVKIRDLKIVTPFQTYSYIDENAFVMQFEWGMAEKFIDDLSKNVKRGIRAKLEKGGWPAMAPLGYLNDRLNKTIIRDPKRFALVRKVWDLMISGCYSVEQILKIANNEWGLRTRRWKRLGGKPLVRSGLYQLLTNPFYKGYLRHKSGFYRGIHEPMITLAEFDKVQEILGRKDKGKPKRHYFPYTGGLIKCGECGCSVTAEHKINRYGYQYTYYHCTKKRRAVKCSQPSLDALRLENQILPFLQKLSIPKSLSAWILKYVDIADEENRLATKEKLSTLKDSLEENNKRTEELNRMRYRGFLDDEEYLKEKGKLLQEKFVLESKLDEKNKKQESLVPILKKTIAFANGASKWFRIGTPEQKRMIMETVGSNLVLRDKILLIQAKIPFRLSETKPFVQTVKNGGFEPRDFSSGKPIFQALPAFSPTGCALMNDVRTFLEGNLDWIGKLDALWDIFGDKG